MSQKRCIFGTKLLQNVNRKPYSIYLMVPLSMTLSDLWPGFQGHDSFRSQVSQKWCVLRTKLLLNTNRKSYTVYRIAPLSMTLSDLWNRFQGHNIFWHWISQKRHEMPCLPPSLTCVCQQIIYKNSHQLKQQKACSLIIPCRSSEV